MQPIEKKARLDSLTGYMLAKISSYLPTDQAVSFLPRVNRAMRATTLQDSRYALALNAELHDHRVDQV